MINPAKVFEVEEDVTAKMEMRMTYLKQDIDFLQERLSDAIKLVKLLAEIYEPTILQCSFKESIRMLTKRTRLEDV